MTPTPPPPKSKVRTSEEWGYECHEKLLPIKFLMFSTRNSQIIELQLRREGGEKHFSLARIFQKRGKLFFGDLK